MKISCGILVLGLIIVSYCDDSAYLKRLEEVDAKCKQETGVDATLVYNAMKKGQFVEDAKLKCYYFCGGREFDRVDAEGSVLPNAFGSNAPSWINQTKAKEVIKTCGALKGSDPCDTAFIQAKCVKLTVEST